MSISVFISFVRWSPRSVNGKKQAKEEETTVLSTGTSVVVLVARTINCEINDCCCKGKEAIIFELFRSTKRFRSGGDSDATVWKQKMETRFIFGVPSSGVECNEVARHQNEKMSKLNQHLDEKNAIKHRIVAKPATSLISVRQAPLPCFADLRSTCRHWANKGAGMQDAKSLASRCLYYLAKEIMEMSAEMEAQQAAKDKTLREVQQELDYWKKKAMNIPFSQPTTTSMPDESTSIKRCECASHMYRYVQP